MKHLLLVAIFSCNFLVAQTHTVPSGETSYNMIDASGFRQGPWIITAALKKLGSPWMPDQKVEEGNYTDSNREGIWVSYYQTGFKRGEVAYLNGKKHGPSKFFSEKGKLISSTDYVNGLPEGLVTTYYPDGTMWTEYHCVHGEIVGNMKTYYPSGKLYEDGTWANGWFIGDYTIYNEDGSVKRVALPPITQ